MSVLTEFTVPAREFILSDALEQVPDVRVEIERVAADDEHVTPYFWAAGETFEAFEAALEDDDSIEDVVTLEEHGSERFYRGSWLQREQTITYAVTCVRATILEATSEEATWNVRMLFPDDETLTAFHDYCSEYELTFELTRLYESRHPEALGKYEVTPKQREAMLTALQEGYFAVPRDTTLEDVAGRLDISPNALSTRLRRGHANLITNTLLHEE